MQLVFRIVGATVLFPSVVLVSTGIITIFHAWQNNQVIGSGILPGAVFLILAGIGLAFTGITLLAWPHKTKDAIRELGQWLQQIFTGM